MKRVSWLLIITVIIALRPWHALAQAPSEQTGFAPEVEQSDGRGLRLLWNPPDYTVATVEVDGRRYSQINLPGITSAGEPGQMELPFYSTLVGLPPGGEARLHIAEIEEEALYLPYPPLPAPVPQLLHLAPTEIDPTEFVSGGLSRREADPAHYATDALLPDATAQLGAPQQLRDRRVAPLTIYPLRVNPVTGQMMVLRHLRLEVTFSEPAPDSDVQTAQSEQNPFNRALDVTLLNPEAAGWRVPQDSLGIQLLPGQGGTPELKVTINSSGLHAITYADLQSAGLPVNSLNPKTFRLSYGYPRQEVAILVEGEADNAFNPADRILFYANPQFNRYVNYDIYFLSYGSGDGLRMATRSGDPTGLPAGTAWLTATAEVDQKYDSLYQGRDGDYWYWQRLSQPDETSADFPIMVQDRLGGGPNSTLTLWLQGYTASAAENPDHRVRVRLNNTVLDTLEWDGKTAYRADLSLSSGLLVNGQNTIRLSLPGITDVFAEGTWLDAVALTYPTNKAGTDQRRWQGETGKKKYSLSGASGSLSLYDVTDPGMPQLVNGYQLNNGTLTVGDVITTPASYLIVPANKIKTPLAFSMAKTITDPPGGADYVIIAHPSLLAAVAPLANHRSGQGIRVATLDVTAIYDAFGPGRMDAEAMRTALQHAYANWAAPAPLYVLLVGDGSYDFKNHLGFNPNMLVPPYMAQVDPWWGETAADNRLVTLVGSDTLPDMLIGRLAVENAMETGVVVNKIIQYETNPPEGLWRANHLFVADNPDGAGNFHQAADSGLALLVPSLVGARYYYGPAGGQPYVYSNVNALRNNMLGAFNQGAGMVTFHGHSSWHQWAVESLLHIGDVASLNNQASLPVVSEMTCFTGFFHHPQYDTLDESLVKRANGGAIAVWGSTGLGVATGHEDLQESFYQAIMQQTETSLGTAALAGKLNIFSTGLNKDLLDTYTLLGDPALNLATVFNPDLSISQAVLPVQAQPGEAITLTLTIKNTGVGTITNVVVTSEISSAVLSPGWSTSFAGVVANGQYQWQLPDLGANASGVIIISGVLDPALPSGFSLINLAEVSGAEPELTLANNVSRILLGGQQVYLPLLLR